MNELNIKFKIIQSGLYFVCFVIVEVLLSVSRQWDRFLGKVESGVADGDPSSPSARSLRELGLHIWQKVTTSSGAVFIRAVGTVRGCYPTSSQGGGGP